MLRRFFYYPFWSKLLPLFAQDRVEQQKRNQTAIFLLSVGLVFGVQHDSWSRLKVPSLEYVDGPLSLSGG